MDSQLDEFKSFVRKYPGLKNDVRSGKATWQSIYEEWYLYGEDDSQWEKYKEVTQVIKARQLRIRQKVKRNQQLHLIVALQHYRGQK